MQAKSIIILLLTVFLFSPISSANEVWQPPRIASEWLTNPVKGAVVEIGTGGADDYESPPYPTLESFQELAILGAQAVRIQSQYLWTIEAPYEPIDRQFEILEGAINNAIEAGLYVIVSVRNGPGTNSMLDLPTEEVTTALFTNPDALDAYKQMLQAMVEHFGDRPEILAWEPLVEPNLNRYLFNDERPPFEQSAPLWNNIASQLIQAIRVVDGERPILISPVNFASPDGFPTLQKFDDDNIIYNVHFYDPFPYTHQFSPPYTNYPGQYYGEVVNRDTLNRYLEPVDAFQAEHNVPVIVGEWGGIRWVPDMPLYFSDLLFLFEEREWSWMFYAWYDASWQRSGFEARWGIDQANLESDPKNPLFSQIILAWNH